MYHSYIPQKYVSHIIIFIFKKFNGIVYTWLDNMKVW